jgi:hypothetical protein
MATLKLSQISVCVMEVCGPMPLDPLHEYEYDSELLVFRVRHILFNEARDLAAVAQGLSLSLYFVQSHVGYWGTYLH